MTHYDVLSYDVANRSIAVSFVRFSLKTIRLGKDLYDAVLMPLIDLCRVKPDLVPTLRGLIRRVAHVIDELASAAYEVRYMCVRDLLGGRRLKEVKTEERAAALKAFNREVQGAIGCTPDAVLIELQMVQNDKSRTVASQCCYHWIDIVPHVELVPAGLKNKFTGWLFRRNTAERYPHIEDFRARYANAYDANKAYSSAVMRCWMQHWATADEHRIATAALASAAKHDDLADSLLQCFAWFESYCHTTR